MKFLEKITAYPNESACYYWFKNNGETYCIYKWGKTGDIESEVFDLIRSMQ